MKITETYGLVVWYSRCGSKRANRLRTGAGKPNILFIMGDIGGTVISTAADDGRREQH
jgi:hypothetical protein